MAATRRVQTAGAPLNAAPSDQDEIRLSKAELNALIANAVSAAVGAASQITPQPAQHIDDKFSAPRTKLEQDFNRRMQENNHLARIIEHEEKEWFSIPKIYEQYIGSVTACINGQTIKIPADGVKRLIPSRYIAVIMPYVENIDKKVATMHATAADQYGGIAELKGGAF